MSAREWKPGDVGIARINKWIGRVFFTGEVWHTEDDECAWRTDLLHEVRPLVVIDPDSREQVERLAADYFAKFWALPIAERFSDAGEDRSPRLVHIAALQAALRCLIEPPKPPEPLGLGAVVIDWRGVIWVRNDLDDDCKWRSSDGAWAEWSEINAVHELSPGIEVRDE